MNYIGSKFKLSDFIIYQIQKITGNNLKDKVFCELFAGTGIISRKLKTKVKQVIINDLEYYSYTLNRNYIGNYKAFDYTKKLHFLNQIEGKEGFIYKNYCLGSGSERLYFSDENGKKIDAIRLKIEEWNTKQSITEDEYFFYLASLLEAADKVANTASVYGAFLKKLKKTAQKKIHLQPAYYAEHENSHQVFNENSNDLIQKIEGTILYLDPPYNARQYGANYHLLNTIALYDKFEPKGKTGLRQYQKSQYCKKTDVADAFEVLIRNANFKYIFLSYNNEGLMSEDFIINTMKKYGKYDLVTKNYQRFKADKDKNRQHKAKSTIEYLHILEKE